MPDGLLPPDPPRPLRELVWDMSEPDVTLELPVTFCVARFHAGRMWVAPMGTLHDPDAGSRPGPAWREVALNAPAT